MNRRDLFRGVAASAIAALAPPVEKFTGLSVSVPLAPGSIWLVVWERFEPRMFYASAGGVVEMTQTGEPAVWL